MIHYDFGDETWYHNNEGVDSFETASKKEVSHGGGKRFFNERDNQHYRSRWEIIVANALHDCGIEFRYEPKRFKFSHKHNETYLPDFYLVKEDAWVEVKGFMDVRSKKRLVLFEREFPEEKMVLIMADEIKRIKDNPPSILWVLYEQGVSLDEIF